MNDTRNDDQQAIVMKQEENQRSSSAADIENKVLTASLETDDNKHQEESVCIWLEKCIDMYVKHLKKL